ncbi:uncharacterized protein LOC124356233 [Homalodisca vitripennis]|uniref:uncharacterized protein LOC124356233 n=1 Tax=Homalodisca vitripennis TaxID=197043 RepID=UPI001EEC9912|nr:uncharacterized protein LOC124356233 [Homalodisca vitripennis]
MSIFHPAVWISAYGCGVLMTVMYWVTFKLSPRRYSMDWSESFVTIYGHLLMTTSHSRGGELSTRYILLGWSAFALLITASFLLRHSLQADSASLHPSGGHTPAAGVAELLLDRPLLCAL